MMESYRARWLLWGRDCDEELVLMWFGVEREEQKEEEEDERMRWEVG